MNSNSMFSRKIKGFDYDPDNTVLIIDFGNGIIKKYLDVSQMIYDSFSSAPDKNIFYQEQIEGRFRVE